MNTFFSRAFIKFPIFLSSNSLVNKFRFKICLLVLFNLITMRPDTIISMRKNRANFGTKKKERYLKKCLRRKECIYLVWTHSFQRNSGSFVQKRSDSRDHSECIDILWIFIALQLVTSQMCLEWTEVLFQCSNWNKYIWLCFVVYTSKYCAKCGIFVIELNFRRWPIFAQDMWHWRNSCAVNGLCVIWLSSMLNVDIYFKKP